MRFEGLRIESCGLDGGEGLGELSFEFSEHELGGADVVFGSSELADRGEGAVVRVLDDFFDGLRGVGGGLGFGEVEAGDLQAVKEQAGSAGVNFVGGDALEDFADAVLDRTAVLRIGEGEGGDSGFALFGVLEGLAGGVVVVTKLFLPEGGAGAAVSVGEDVAALEAHFGVG